jgi:hypothetical protein
MIQTDTSRAGVSSHDQPGVNGDASVDLNFGPSPAAGKGNWIKTLPGKFGLPTSDGTGRRKPALTRAGSSKTSCESTELACAWREAIEP